LFKLSSVIKYAFSHFIIIITGWTPIHQAAENGHEQVCKLIMDKIKDKNPADLKGRTPLHIAAKNGYLAVCELILDELEDKNKHVNPKVNQSSTSSVYSFLAF
jgi:ankyrin repeat protein